MFNKKKILAMILATATVFSSVNTFAAINIPSKITLGTAIYIPLSDITTDTGRDSNKVSQSDYQRMKSNIVNSQTTIDSNADKILQYLGFNPPTSEDEKKHLLEGSLPDKKSGVLTEEEFWDLIKNRRNQVTEQYKKNRIDQKHKAEKANQSDAIRTIRDAVINSLNDINPKTGKKNDHNAGDDLNEDLSRAQREVQSEADANYKKLYEKAYADWLAQKERIEQMNAEDLQRYLENENYDMLDYDYIDNDSEELADDKFEGLSVNEDLLKEKQAALEKANAPQSFEDYKKQRIANAQTALDNYYGRTDEDKMKEELYDAVEKVQEYTDAGDLKKAQKAQEKVKKINLELDAYQRFYKDPKDVIDGKVDLKKEHETAEKAKKAAIKKGVVSADVAEITYRCGKCGATYSNLRPCNCGKKVVQKVYKYLKTTGTGAVMGGRINLADGTTARISKENWESQIGKYSSANPGSLIEPTDEEYNSDIIVNLDPNFVQADACLCAHCHMPLFTNSLDIHSNDGVSYVLSTGEHVHAKCWNAYADSKGFSADKDDNTKWSDADYLIPENTDSADWNKEKKLWVFSVDTDNVAAEPLVRMATNFRLKNPREIPPFEPPEKPAPPDTTPIPDFSDEDTDQWDDGFKDEIIDEMTGDQYENDQQALSEADEAVTNIEDDIDKRLGETDEIQDPTFSPFGYYPADPSKFTGKQKEAWDKWSSLVQNDPEARKVLLDMISKGVFDNLNFTDKNGNNVGTGPGGLTKDDLQKKVEDTLKAINDYLAQYTAIDDKVKVTVTFDDDKNDVVALDQVYSIPGYKEIVIHDNSGKTGDITFGSSAYWQPSEIGTYTIKRYASYITCHAKIVTTNTTMRIIATDSAGNEYELYNKTVKRIKEDIDGLETATETPVLVDTHSVTVVPSNVDINKSDFYDTERIKNSN